MCDVARNHTVKALIKTPRGAPWRTGGSSRVNGNRDKGCDIRTNRQTDRHIQQIHIRFIPKSHACLHYVLYCTQLACRECHAVLAEEGGRGTNRELRLQCWAQRLSTRGEEVQWRKEEGNRRNSMHKKEKWGEKKQMELISKHLHTITTMTNTLK